MQKPKTLLVTGGAGFIGANFIHYWLDKHPQDKIINLDLLTYAGNLANLSAIADHQNYKFIEGDVGDGNLVDRLMVDASVVVHFAAETHVDRSILTPAKFLQTNVVGTQVLLEAALKHKVKHFHHISTDEVFGSLALDSGEQFTEETAYDPRSPYSASKASSDHLVRAYGETYGLPYTITNCSNNYGPYQHPEKLIPLAIVSLLNDQQVPIYGDGLYVRDWLFVKDHCRAIELVLESSPNQETYLVGGLTKDVNNLELVKLLLEIMKKPDDMIEFVKDRPGHDRRYSINWQKIKTKLGWQPELDLMGGLQKTVEWYTQHPEWWKPLVSASQDFFEKNYSPKK